MRLSEYCISFILKKVLVWSYLDAGILDNSSTRPSLLGVG